MRQLIDINLTTPIRSFASWWKIDLETVLKIKGFIYLTAELYYNEQSLRLQK